MDYPHPLLKVDENKIDFSEAYSVGIVDWDKVSVAYSYSEIKEEDKKLHLDNILNDAYKSGLRFITDSDARSISGSHVNAHLWDNGKNVTNNLNDLFNIRKKAILNFSKFNIKKGEPYSKLEDLFVPLYFMHRYQTEAVIKLIGGMDYNYSTRGDGQLIVKDLEYKIQNDALQSLLKSLDAKHLTIPKNILNLFPPRAYGYPRNRESFKGRTGVSFDPFSVAQTASEFSINLLLNTERLNRIKFQSSVNSSRFNLNKLFDDILFYTFGKTHKDEYLNEIQHIINTNILTYLLKITIDKNAFVQVKNTANKYINLINNNYFKSLKVHYEDYQFIIKDFKINPESYMGKISKKIPAGLLSLIIGTLISFTFKKEWGWHWDYSTIGDIPSDLPQIVLPFSEFLNISFSEFSIAVVSGLTLAGLGTIDTLLTSVVADNLTKTKHNGNRELLGQGIGNFVAALFGGLP